LGFGFNPVFVREEKDSFRTIKNKIIVNYFLFLNLLARMDESELIKDRELKQIYLKEQVINLGYDGGQFADFLATRRENGTDVDVWTYEELIAIVQEFRSSFEDLQRENFFEGEQINLESDSNTVLLESGDLVKLENLKKRTIIGGNAKTKCKIIKEEKIKTGTFSTDIFYTIQTTPMDYSVKRSFKHFEWLRSKLFDTYPGAFVPPIESDSNRSAFLNNFLKSILERRELRNLQVFEDFLKLEKLESAYKSLKPIDRKKNLSGIMDAFSGDNINQLTLHEYKKMCQKSITGGLMAKSGLKDENLTKFAAELDNLIDANAPLMSKMKHSAIEVKKCFTDASKHLFHLGQHMAKIIRNKERFNKLCSLEEDKNAESILKVLQKGFAGWGTH
jgi:hypothetical protein